ncbi:MAG: hypothetical protein ONB16_04415 [candidate division KSB1 bacterium]|nr:hypothetical protein [candidate division KSB1 bacterium]MDZ7319436.1 hypothetical protein [candidate division KSB1 bacterium]MDZ7340630.1 hypothetical protein [candidate division KSB1 bacterium]
MNMRFLWLMVILFLLVTSCGWTQHLDRILVPQMERYESDIQSTYREYQKIYYEKKSSLAELRAFENVISIYVSQILEVYETLSLSGLGELEIPRDIAARALVYRALIFLEKAPLNPEYYEKACYDYYNALAMFDNIESIPAIFKRLPEPILVGANEFNRLIDVIDHKGSDLYAFGKVRLNLRNFKITTNLDIDNMEFVRIECPPDKKKYTYYAAEQLIKDNFKKVLSDEGQSTTFLALPEGSYFIRPKSQSASRHIYLSAIYVRSNQQHNYFVEPLVDWFIMYEDPSTRKPKYAKTASSDSENPIKGNGKDENKSAGGSSKKGKSIEKVLALSQLVNSNLERVDSNSIFNLKDPWIRNRFATTAAEIIYAHVETINYYNCWSRWMLAWIIAKEITNKFSPESIVPTELIKLVHEVLKGI